ncbi:MAG: hypothetical protein Q8R28_04000 [Dehalococcoidia bacterium]|nr:hypothetical protein [Dehalococcoidia bacterium]
MAGSGTERITILTSDRCGPCKKIKELLAGETVEGADLELLTLEDETQGDRIMELIEKHDVSFFPAAIISGQVCSVAVVKGEIQFDCSDGDGDGDGAGGEE